MVRDLLASRARWRLLLQGRTTRHFLQLLSADHSQTRQVLDSIFAALEDNEALGRTRIDRVAFSEFGYLQAWLQRERPPALRAAHGISQRTFDEAGDVWRHFTRGLSIDSPRVNTAPLPVGSSRIERAALLRTYNKRLGVERRPVAGMLSGRYELTHWEGDGAARLSHRRARMYAL